MVAALALPPQGAAVRGGVVVLGGSQGGIPEAEATSFAEAGFAALAVAYFGQPPLPAHLSEVPVETVGTALDWLIAHHPAGHQRVAVVGRSKGGELALLSGATYPDKVNAVVGYVPSPIVWQGLAFDRRSRQSPKPSWTIGGKPLDFLPFARPKPAEMLGMMGMLIGRAPALRPLYERALEDQEAVKRAMIPIERITGPVLLVSGTDDQLWPSTPLCELAIERLRAHGHPFPHEHLRYEGAGHMIAPPTAAPGHSTVTRRYRLGGTDQANAAASAQAWPKVLSAIVAA
jgi:dienelactone hydrolase